MSAQRSSNERDPRAATAAGGLTRTANYSSEKELVSPVGHQLDGSPALTPVPPIPQYPPGFLNKYCWW